MGTAVASATVIVLPQKLPEQVHDDLIEHQVDLEFRAFGQYRVRSRYADVTQPIDAYLRLRDTLNEMVTTRGGLSFAIFNVKAAWEES